MDYEMTQCTTAAIRRLKDKFGHQKLPEAKEVEALHVIVLHSGERLYDRVPLCDFLADLQQRCVNVPLTGVASKMNAVYEVQCHLQVCVHAYAHTPGIKLTFPFTYCRLSLS